LNAININVSDLKEEFLDVTLLVDSGLKGSKYEAVIGFESKISDSERDSNKS
jgi:hypothetical protein